MKKVFLLAIAAIVVASVSVLMANPVLNNAESSSFVVNDIYEGTYIGDCTNVVMNDSVVPDADNVKFTVTESGGSYYFTGTVYIAVTKDGFFVEHYINFTTLKFAINSDGTIGVFSGGGTISVYVDSIPMGTYDFIVDTLTGVFGNNTLDFHIHCLVPELGTFYAEFDYSGTK
jgi:hypothetical protein